MKKCLSFVPLFVLFSIVLSGLLLVNGVSAAPEDCRLDQSALSGSYDFTTEQGTVSITAIDPVSGDNSNCANDYIIVYWTIDDNMLGQSNITTPSDNSLYVYDNYPAFPGGVQPVHILLFNQFNTAIDDQTYSYDFGVNTPPIIPAGSYWTNQRVAFWFAQFILLGVGVYII